MNRDDYMARMFYGEHARHVPVWCWIQDQGSGTVLIAGASRVQSGLHPLRYNSVAVHQFVLGELILRPHVVIETNEFKGQSVSGLLTMGVSLRQLAETGVVIADPKGHFKKEPV